MGSCRCRRQSPVRGTKGRSALLSIHLISDRPLTEQQLEAFSAIASPMMERLGYAEREAYVVNY